MIWTLLTDQLPETNKLVLLSCEDGQVVEGKVSYLGNCYDVANDQIKAVAWMLKPESYSPAPDKKYCRGCENDFYNGNNPLGIKECWSFSGAKVVTKFKLPSNVPMCERDQYVKVVVHNCARHKGHVLLDRIP